MDKSAATGVALDVWFYNAMPTTVADNVAFSMVDAELSKVLGHIKVASTDYSSEALGCLGCVRNINLILEAAAKTKSLWVSLVTRGGPTYATGDITLKFGLQQK